MKNSVVIGHAPAAHAAVRALLDRDPTLAITLISCDGQLPYDKTLLPGLIDRSVKEAGIFCAPEDMYRAARVELILDKEISRVNFNRKRVFLADKVQVDFDGLIITDAPQIQWPQLKGIRRQGVFHLARLSMVKDLVRYLAFTETALVEASGFGGIKAALALKAAGKDVVVAYSGDNLLAGLISAARAQALTAALLKRGIRVMAGGVEDVIGEVEVKAVRLKSGKVVACDMFVLENVKPDLRFLSDTGLAMDERIPVDIFLRSNIPGVLAVDVVARLEQPEFRGEYWLDARTGSVQARAAVDGFLGEGRALTPVDIAQADILDTLFDPLELVPVMSEAAV